MMHEIFCACFLYLPFVNFAAPAVNKSTHNWDQQQWKCACVVSVYLCTSTGFIYTLAARQPDRLIECIK